MLSKINVGILALGLGGMIVTGATGANLSTLSHSFSNAVPAQVSNMLPADMANTVQKVNSADRSSLGFSRDKLQQVQREIASDEALVRASQANGKAHAESVRRNFEAKQAANNEMMKGLQSRTPVLPSSQKN